MTKKQVRKVINLDGLTNEDVGHTKTLIAKLPVPKHPAKGCDRCYNIAIRK